MHEANYSALLGMFWHEASHHAADNNLINNGHHGRHPSHTAHGPVVAEELINMPGVIEAILVHNESVAYLKVDDKLVDLAKVKHLLRPQL